MSTVDGQGAVVASYNYDPYGNLISDEPAENTIGHLNPIRYRGYIFDSETQLYYLQSRYYDPELGHFINADAFASTGQGILGNNMFAYCGNNPIVAVDPTGEAFFLVTAAIGAVAGAIIGGIVAAKNGGNVWAGIGIGATVGGLAGAGLGAAAGVILAGSAAASTASVAIGANALAATASASGIAAGCMMIADNISQAVNRAPQVFWSGGEKAMNAARSFAESIDGITLEMTRLGQHLEQLPFNRDAWSAASQNFANVANNAASAIHVVHNATGVSIQSIWATIEYPLLKMAEMIYHVVQ